MRWPAWKTLLLLTLSPAPLLAYEPAEELPPPKTEESVLTKTTAPPQITEQNPWGLVGPQFRFYCLGAEGVIDYQQSGERRVGKLQAEDPAGHARHDPNFHYFRETGTGNRWAIGRQPGAGGQHRVYFQAVDAAKSWVLHERARGTWEPEAPLLAVEPDAVLIWDEPACGR
jgi:hypothetical protein